MFLFLRGSGRGEGWREGLWSLIVCFVCSLCPIKLPMFVFRDVFALLTLPRTTVGTLFIFIKYARVKDTEKGLDFI